MKKRIFSFVLALCLVFGTALPAFAANKSNPLRFDENGEFTILHICDCQDGYPAKEKMFTYIEYMLDTYKPDLVVLGGDNTVGPKETKSDAIKELVSPFVKNKVYFTLVFGNHDHEQGVDKEELLKMYQKHGGKYCLAYDADPSLHGCAIHNLPVLSSDGKEIKFNIWLFDTNTYVYDENDPTKRLGYDSVREDQVKWYNETYAELKEEAGGTVHSLAFQHMVPPEVYDAMFPRFFIEMSPLTETYNNGRIYPIFLPKTSAFKGHLYEPPSPGVFNYGQYDAMVKNGDVLGIFAGHDHINSYEIKHKGIKIVNTPGVTFNAYGNEFVRGSRVITVNEDDTSEFDSDVMTVNRVALMNKEFAEDMEISRFSAGFWSVLGNVLLLLKRVSGIVTWIF